MRVKRLHSLPGILPAVLVFFLSRLSLDAQDARIRASLDTGEILLGDQVSLHLEVLVSDKRVPVFPVFGDNLVKGVEVLAEEPADSSAAGNSYTRYRKSYLLTSFDSGFYQVPPLPVVLPAAGEHDTLYTDPLGLMVHTLPPDTSVTFYDIKAPYGSPPGFREMVPYLAGILALLAVAGMVVYYLRKRQKKDYHPERPAPGVPPHVYALNALEDLRDQKLWQMGRVKLYHSLLTEILRVYIELRFAVKAMEETSSEILRDLEGTGLIKEGILPGLAGVLQLADLVKFARFEPLSGDNEKSMESAVRFVKLTCQEEQPPGNGRSEKSGGKPVTGEEGSEAVSVPGGNGKEVLNG